MGSQPEKVDFQGDPKVGQGPNSFTDTPPGPNFLSGPCLYQADPCFHQCTNKISLGPTTTIFNVAGHALGYLIRVSVIGQGEFCSPAYKNQQINIL